MNNKDENIDNGLGGIDLPEGTTQEDVDDALNIINDSIERIKAEAEARDIINQHIAKMQYQDKMWAEINDRTARYVKHQIEIESGEKERDPKQIYDIVKWELDEIDRKEGRDPAQRPFPDMDEFKGLMEKARVRRLAREFATVPRDERYKYALARERLPEHVKNLFDDYYREYASPVDLGFGSRLILATKAGVENIAATVPRGVGITFANILSGGMTFGGMAMDIARAKDQPKDDEEIYAKKTMREFEAFIKPLYIKSPGFWGMLDRAIIGLAEIAPDLAVSAAVSPIPGGLPAYWMARISGSRYQEYREAGMNDTDARLAANLSAIIETPVEMMKFEWLTGNMFGIKEIVSKSFVNSLGRLALWGTLAIPVEVLEEGIQEAVSTAIKGIYSYAYDNMPDMNPLEVAEAFGKAAKESIGPLSIATFIGHASKIPAVHRAAAEYRTELARKKWRRDMQFAAKLADPEYVRELLGTEAGVWFFEQIKKKTVRGLTGSEYGIDIKGFDDIFGIQMPVDDPIASGRAIDRIIDNFYVQDHAAKATLLPMLRKEAKAEPPAAIPKMTVEAEQEEYKLPPIPHEMFDNPEMIKQFVDEEWEAALRISELTEEQATRTNLYRELGGPAETSRRQRMSFIEQVRQQVAETIKGVDAEIDNIASGQDAWTNLKKKAKELDVAIPAGKSKAGLIADLKAAARARLLVTKKEEKVARAMPGYKAIGTSIPAEQRSLPEPAIIRENVSPEVDAFASDDKVIAYITENPMRAIKLIAETEMSADKFKAAVPGAPEMTANDRLFFLSRVRANMGAAKENVKQKFDKMDYASLAAWAKENLGFKNAEKTREKRLREAVNQYIEVSFGAEPEKAIPPKSMLAAFAEGILKGRGVQAKEFTTAQMIAELGNIQTTGAMSPLRDAEVYRNKISEEDIRSIDSLNINEDESFGDYLASPRGRDMRMNILKSMAAAKAKSFFTTTGELTIAGRELVRNIMLLRVFDADILELAPETRKELLHTLEACVAELIVLDRIDRNKIVIPGLKKALEILVRVPGIENEAMFNDYMAQMALPGMEETMIDVDRMASAWGRILLENGNKPKVMRQHLKNIIASTDKTLFSTEVSAEKALYDEFGMKPPKFTTIKPKEAQPETAVKPKEEKVVEKEIVNPIVPAVTADNIKAVFPGAEIADIAGGWSVKLPNGFSFDVKMVDDIKVDWEAAEKAYGTMFTPEQRERIHARGSISFIIDGKDMTLRGLMKLSEGLARKSTVFHEAVHIARKLGLFTTAEWNALKNKYAPNVADDKMAEEIIARSMFNTRKDEGKSWFKRVGKFISGIINRLRGNMTKAEISIIMDEKFWSRTPAPQAPIASQGEMFEIDVDEVWNTDEQIRAREKRNSVPIAKKLNLLEKTKNLFKTMAMGVRTHAYIPQRDPYYALAREFFSRQDGLKTRIPEEASNLIGGITYGLSKPEYHLFSKILALRNEAINMSEGRPTRFGYKDIKAINDEEARLIALAHNKAPKVIESLQRRREFINQLVKECVDYNVLDASVLASAEVYYHQQVFAHVKLNSALVKGGAMTAQRSFQKERLLAQQVQKARNDLYNKAKKEGREITDEELANLPELPDMGDEYDYNLMYHEAEMEWVCDAKAKVETIKLFNQFIKPYHDKVAAQFTQALINKGIAPPDNYNAIITGLNNGNEEYIRVFETMKDCVIWSAQPGSALYPAATLDEKLIEHLHSHLLKKLGKLADNFEFGDSFGRMPKYILPAPIAAQLNSTKKPTDGFWQRASKLSAGLLTAEKNMYLFMPNKFIGYMVSNIFGDLEPTIGAAPGVFRMKYLLPAMREIARYYWNPTAPISERLKAARDLNTIDSSITAQELSQLKNLTWFKDFAESDGIKNVPANMWSRYWDMTKRLNRTRESVLRYAAFNYYMDELKAHYEQGKKIHFGGSMEANIDELYKSSPEVAAAAMSRNLLGDYGNISIIGQTLARHIWPFWRWPEVNIKRTPQLIINTLKYGKENNVLATSLMAGLAGLRLASFALACRLWNWLLFPDDERSLTAREQSQPHILFGRTMSGDVISIRNISAFANAFEWLGLDRIIEYLPKWADGQVRMSDVLGEALKAPVNKIMRGVRPDVKMMFEAGTETTTFPDFFNLRFIRADEAIANFFGMRDEYREIMGRIFSTGVRGRPNFMAKWLGLGVNRVKEDATREMYALRDSYLKMRGHEPKRLLGESDFQAMREAVYGGDYDAFVEARRVYLQKPDRGYKSFEASIRSLDPISTKLSDEAEIDFEQNYLNDIQREKLRLSQDYTHELGLTMWLWWRQAAEMDDPELRDRVMRDIRHSVGVQAEKMGRTYSKKNTAAIDEAVEWLKERGIGKKEAARAIIENAKDRKEKPPLETLRRFYARAKRLER